MTSDDDRSKDILGPNGKVISDAIGKKLREAKTFALRDDERGFLYRAGQLTGKIQRLIQAQSGRTSNSAKAAAPGEAPSQSDQKVAPVLPPPPQSGRAHRNAMEVIPPSDALESAQANAELATEEEDKKNLLAFQSRSDKAREAIISRVESLASRADASPSPVPAQFTKFLDRDGSAADAIYGLTDAELGGFYSVLYRSEMIFEADCSDGVLRNRREKALIDSMFDDPGATLQCNVSVHDKFKFRLRRSIASFDANEKDLLRYFYYLHRLREPEPPTPMHEIADSIAPAICNRFNCDISYVGGGGFARQYEQELPTKLRIPGPEHSFERIGRELKTAQQPNDEHPLQYGEELARVRFGTPHSVVVEQADVFISYSRHDAADALAIASGLNERGIKVWYDVSISGGDRFAAKIDSQLEAARAVVVLWSPESIRSDWVAYEAAKAHKQNKLIPICLPPLATESVPPPYPAVLNIIRHGDQERLLSALARLGVAVPGP